MSTAVTTAKDWASDQEVRWCPGCGDYSILKAVQLLMPELGGSTENTVFISGIGCAARFPYYMNTYGMHSIHGRAPAIATGLAMAREDLDVWVVGGDGDMLSIGGNHLIHALRRNINLTILMFNNQIYGLTKGQYSPTSEVGKVTKSTPFGSLDHPFNPVSVALGADASFVARVLDVDAKLMPVVLERAAAHGGASFVEILQNCSIFNDGAWADISDRKTKHATQLELQHGLPLLFDKGTKGIGLDNRMHPRVVDVEAEGLDKVLVHDETNPALAYLLSRLEHPDFPTPVGVFHAVERPTYDDMLHAQVADARKRRPGLSVQNAIEEAQIWEVK